MKQNFTRSLFNAVRGSLSIWFAVIAFSLASISSHAQGTTFTNPSSPFVIPANVTSIVVQCWGGGGGGAGNNNVTRSGSGGGGGAYATKTIAVTPLTAYYLNVGTVGAAGTSAATPGGTGGTSWFNSSNTQVGALVLAVGGGGGICTANTPGAGGASGACTGTTVFSGGNGGGNKNPGGNIGGGSGGSSAGTGANGVAGTQSNTASSPGATAPSGGGNGGASGYTATAPIAGNAPGGGGGGAADLLNESGGTGGLGQVSITYYLPTISTFLPNPACAGVSTLTITGTNFTPSGTITFTGASPVAYTYISASSISVLVPALATTGTFTITTTEGIVTSGSVLTINTVPAMPTFSNSGTPNVCPGAAETYGVNDLGFTYNWTVVGGGWSPTSGTGITFNTTAGTVNGAISVTAKSGACTSPAANVTTTVIQTPTQPSAILPTAAVCPGSTQTYSVTGIAGLTYTWTVPGGWGINSGQNSSSINVTVGTATGTITATPYNSCGVSGTPQTQSITVNPATVTPSAPIPATGYISAGATAVTVYGFTLTPTACASGYSFLSVQITTAGTATSAELSNFDLYYDVNANGVYDAGDVPVSGPLSLAGVMTFAISAQTNITAARNYILVADVANGSVPGHTFTAGISNGSGISFTGATQSGTLGGYTQTIEGSVAIAAIQPAAAFVFQSSTNNPVAAYSVTVNSGSSYTPGSFTFNTAGAYAAGTADFANYKLWQSNSSPFNAGSSTMLEQITASGSAPQTLIFNTFSTAPTAIALSGTSYFYITTDVSATGTNGDFVKIATDALSNFGFTAAAVASGTNPATVGNAQTIKVEVVTITQAHPAIGNINQNSVSAIASYMVSVANFPVTPTSFVFTTAGTYSNTTDVTNLTLYENTTNSLSGASLIQSAGAPATGGTVTFTGISSLPVGTYYFIVAATVATCAANGNTIFLNAGTANFANFSFSTIGVQVTGPTNPVPASNTQTIISPVVTLTTSHPVAGNLTQGTTNNIIASYYLSATNFNITPTSFTFTTGGVYAPGADFTNFQLWVNSTKDSINGATLIGSFGTDPATGASINFASFPAAATIAAGTGSYFFITVDVPLTALSGDYVYIAKDNVTNFSFSSTTGGCVTRSPSSGNLAVSNNQSIFGPSVVIATSHPAAGNIADGSTNNILAVYSLTVSNAVSVTPTNLTLTTGGNYVPGDLVNFKVYENTNATLLGTPTLAQTVTIIPSSGGTITFNSGFTAIGSAVTTYLIVTADVAPTATVGDSIRFTATPFTNFSFLSSTGSGVVKNGSNPANTSKYQKIVGPQVAIGTNHNPAGNMVRGSQNNLLAIYSVTVSNAPVTPTSATFVTAGTYAGLNDIQDFNLYQNGSPSLTGATLVGTVTATGITSGQTLVYNSGFSSITNVSPNNVSYLILVADVAGSATAGDYISIAGITTPSANFSFTSISPVTITTITSLAASNNQTILNALSVYWSNSTNPQSWDNVTNNWSYISGGPYTTSVWLENGYGVFEGTAGRINVVSPAANIVADSLTSNVNNYQIDATASTNGITMVSPASFTVNTGTTYIGLNYTTNPVIGGNNGLVKRGTGELQIASPFRAGFAGNIYIDQGEFTLGAKNGNSDPNLFLQGNGITINNARLTLAGHNSIQPGGLGRYSYASPRNLIQFQAFGNDTLNFYQTTYDTTHWMRIWPTSDGNIPADSTSTTTPFQISGTLTLTPAGVVTGIAGINFNQQNTIVTGSTTFTGNTTLVAYASSGASVSARTGTHLNFNIGGSGHYLYGVKSNYANGTVADNGNSLTFLGGGNSTTDGAELCLNSTASTLTGNWTIGDAAGTNAGWMATNTTTCLTIGTATVNNYSKLALQVTASHTKNITYSPSTIYLYGLGPANQAYYPSALDLNNQTNDTVSLVLLPSNIVLNPIGATTLASIGVEVGGTVNNLVTYQLNGIVSGTAGLEKTGPGNLALNAQNSSGYFNTYSGNTQVNEGVLTVNYGSNLGTGTGGILLSQVSDPFGGTDSNHYAGFNTQLILNNTTQTASSIATSWVNTDGETQILTLNGCTFIDNQSIGTTFGNSATGTSLGYISGTGTFIKSGAGTLTLTGPNTYTGLTQVKAGTLALSHTGGATLPTTNSVDILGGTLSVTTAQTLKNVTLSTGILNIASGVTLTITGNFTLVNGTFSGTGTIAYSNGTLIYAGSSAQTVNNGTISEWPAANVPTNVSFDNNTYTGYTTGGVKLVAGRTIPSGGTAIVNGWLDFAGNSITGAGAFTLNGLATRSYTGNTAIGFPYITNMSSYIGIYPGMLVTGPGVPANTYIIYIDTVLQSSSGTSTLYLNNNATVTGATVALSFTIRGGVKISLPTGLDNSGTGHVQVTGTKTYNSGASYVFNTPTSGTQIYPGFPTTPATATYTPAWDVKINVGSGNNITMAASGTGSTIEVADSLVLSTGVWATNTGLITWDNPGTSYLNVPQPTWAANSTTYINSFIATCDNSGTPVNVAGASSAFAGTAGFKIKSVTNVDTYFPVGASFIAAYPSYSSLPSPNRMMINNNFGTPEDFTVVVNYGDVGFTYGSSGGAYRVNRIWYIKTSASQDVGKATMKLFYTKRDNSVGNWLWPAAGGENEVEAGFMYTQNSLVEKDYSGIGTNFIRLSDNGDVMDFSNAATYPLNTEVYGVYTIGVSKAIDSSTNGIQLFNRFSVVNPTGIVLPVKVIDFRAYQQGSGVQIGWTCLNEMNMDYYEVERSANATDFVTLGSVAALNSGQPSVNYSFYDRQPLQGDNYYRIKVLGKDGSISYTNTEVVVIGGGLSGINIFPNPVTQHTFTLQLANIPAGRYTLIIFNTLGQKLLNQEINHAGGSASQTIYLPAGTARGEYHVKLFGTGLEVNKMMTVE